MRAPEAISWSALADPVNSVLAVEVTPPSSDGTTTLAVRAVAAGGRTLERFTLVRSHAGGPRGRPLPKTG